MLMKSALKFTEMTCVLFEKAAELNSNRGADEYLARPERKQATATEDFDVHISYLLS